MEWISSFLFIRKAEKWNFSIVFYFQIRSDPLKYMHNLISIHQGDMIRKFPNLIPPFIGLIPCQLFSPKMVLTTSLRSCWILEASSWNSSVVNLEKEEATDMNWKSSSCCSRVVIFSEFFSLIPCASSRLSLIISLFSCRCVS